MRKFAAALTLTACLVVTNLAFCQRSVLSLPAYASTDGIPAATSFIYPVGQSTIQPTWDPANQNGYFVTQGFNTSCDPAVGEGFYLYSLYYCGHTGVDLATSGADAQVHATAAGIVVEAGYNAGYGVMVRIQHDLPNGNVVYSQYEHMAYGSLSVYNGEQVSKGQELGLVGATGFATGAHLHFEIKSVNEDGWGYTFGNAAMLNGYFEPLSFVAQHQLQPASYISSTGRTTPVWPAESELILKRFLQGYKHYVVVRADGLNVRSRAGIHAAVLGTVLRGAKLGYVRTAGQWIEVALPQNVRGWVNLKWVAGYQDWSRVQPVQRAQASWPPPGPVVTVAADPGLNVHAGPGQSHAVVSSVYHGDALAVLTLTTNWAKVLTRDGTRGWVLRRWLNEPHDAGSAHVARSPAAVQVRTPAIRYIVPTTPFLHVRTGPGLQYPVSGSIYSGTQMQLVRTTPNWGAVILPGNTTGWVALQYTAAPGSPAARHVSGAAPSVLAVHAMYLKVATSVLNIHSGPSQSYAVIATVRGETSLQAIALTSNWAHVALPASNIDGWVLRRLTD